MSTIVSVEAIHSGMTSNLNFYPRAGLEQAAQTWVKPYNKPLIRNHDIDSEPLGRVRDVEFGRSKLKRGAYCTTLIIEVNDPDAEQKVRDGRYSTVSVGTICKGAVCSICKTNWAEEPCEHIKGRVYEDKLCYWIMEPEEHVEVSFVNHPADPFAQVLSVNEAVQAEYSYNEAGNIQDRRLQETAMDNIVDETMKAFKEADTEQDVPVEEQADQEAAQESGSQDIPVAEGGVSKRELDEVKACVASLEENIAQIEARLEESARKLSAVMEQNVELARIINEETIDHYSDLAVAAGEFQTREEARAKAEEMPIRQLRKEIARLAAAPVQRVIETVGIPGGSGEVVEVPSKSEHKEGYTLKDLETSMLKLLGA